MISLTPNVRRFLGLDEFDVQQQSAPPDEIQAPVTPVDSSQWDAAQQPSTPADWSQPVQPEPVYDPRQHDEGQRETGPAPWTPISPNTPEPTYQIADGRQEPPTPTGQWEPARTAPRAQTVAEEPPNPYGAPRSAAADLNPGAPADYGDGGQARRAAQQPEISSARPVQSSYGEPDYVDRRSDAERLLTTPVAMPARRELPPYDPERAARDPGYNASRSRTQDDVAAIPYQALEAIRQSVLDVVNNAEDTGTAWGEQRKVAALGNALLGVANTLGLPYNVVARTVNQMFPEMTIAGVGVGDVLSLYHDAFRLGAGATGVVQSAWQGKPVAAFERGVEMLGRGQEIADNAIEAARPVVGAAVQGVKRAGRAMGEEIAGQLLDLPTVPRMAQAGEGGLSTAAKRLTADEAGSVVDYLAIRHDALNGSNAADQLVGKTPEEIRQTLQQWHAQGVFPEVKDARAFDEEIMSALSAAERDAQGRRVDPAMERAGYGQRATGDYADASPMSGTASENRRFGDDGYTNRLDPGTTPPPEIPRTVDDAPRDNSFSANATPGISRSAGLIGDAANSIGGGVMGAATGAALPADSEEQRRQNALTGAGIGMIAGPAAGRMLPRTGGALATFGASPNYRGPSAAQVQAAEKAGAARGARLNREVQAPGSAVPMRVRAATAATDDRAAMRWAEDMLSDAAGNPRMRENDPARPSTQSRVNAGSIADERITNELEKPVVDAARAGLQDELPQYLEDVHHKDILDEFYNRGYQAEEQAMQQRIATAQANGASVATIQRMQANVQPRAHAAGERAMRRRQGSNPEHSYEATEARLQAQEKRLKADGRWQPLQDAADGVWKSNKETRDRMVAAGLMDPAEAAYYEQAYPHYVPTVPISHLDPSAGSGPVAAATGPKVSAGRQKPVHALDDVGTSGDRLNPIVASRNNLVRAERQIQRNNVAAAFAQMMDDAMAASPGTVKTGADHRTFLGGGVDVTYWANGKPMTISVPKEVADGLESAANMGADPGKVGRWWKKVMSVFTAAMTAGRASFLPVNLMRDAQDYALRTAAREGGPHNLPGIMGTWFDEAGKAAADIMMAQLNPRGFAGAAVGGIAGAAQGDENTTPAERIRHAAEGAVAGTFLIGANKVKPTGKAVEFLARGGGSGGLSAHWGAGQRWYRDVMRDGGAVVRNPADAARYVGDWLSDIASLQGIKGINERTELISRTAAMRRADTQKLPGVEAMIAGRDASVDFDRAGTVARMVNGIVPFFNATVQGGAQFGRLLKKNPIAAGSTLVTTVAPVMLGLEAWNRSDPARAEVYNDIPDYLKQTGLIAVLPWSGSDNRGERPNYLWIPTGAATPIVMGMRRAMENLPGLEPTAGTVGDRPDASGFEKWGNTLADVVMSFSPLRGESASSLASNLVPQGVKQVFELGLNKDLYRGNQIMTDPADERASVVSRGIASAANSAGRMVGNDFLQNMRPSGVEHVMNSLPAYADIVKGASDMTAPSGYKQAEDRPIQNEPFVGGMAGRFVRDTGGANLQRAQNAAMSDSVRAVLEDAGMRPNQVDLSVPSEYKKAPLTRDEHLRWQNIFNSELVRSINEARRSDQWRNPTTREEAVKKAISTARQNAAERARMPSDQQIENRIRQQQSMKAS